MSGNEVFWKIRYEPSIDGTNTPYRTLVVYKETHTIDTDTGELQPPRKIDPMKDVWTGTWRDASPVNPEGAQPENALTGTIFTVNANRQDPLIIPAKFRKLRFWRNTEVAKLRDGEQLVLRQRHARSRMGRGSRQRLPARRAHSPVGNDDRRRAVPDRRRLGLRRRDGDAQPGAVSREERRARVRRRLRAVHLGPRQLPRQPDGSGQRARIRISFRVAYDPYGPSKVIQQATVNLFADMGIQPANLQPDLVPRDALDRQERRRCRGLCLRRTGPASAAR